MAKNSDDLAIVYDNVFVTVGALAANDCISSNSKIDSARENGFRIMKTEYWIEWFGKTSGQGPLMVGFSPTKSSATVEEGIEADPQSYADRTGNMKAKEPIFPLVMIPTTSTEVGEDQHAHKGEFKPRWSTPEGVNAIWWVYNLNTAGLTTGTVVNIFAKHYGVWLRD